MERMANGRYVIITGGSRGLGLAIVRRLSAAGYSVIAASRSCSPELSEIIAARSEEIHFEQLDLSHIAGLHEWVGRVIEKYGVPYGLVNNAAIAYDGVLGTMHESQITELLTVNVTATIIFTKYVSRAMLRGRQGRIVNISSIIASTGFHGLSVYAASKAALNGFTKSLARELGRVGITVNSLAPGYMKTDMSAGIDDMKMNQITRRSALGRLATVDEAAASVEFLLSDDASATTGIILTVDAGNTA